MTSRQPARRIEEVLREETERLMALPSVVGTALSLRGGKPCIMVYVETDAAAAARGIPGSLDGYPVQVEEAGKITARSGTDATEGARDATGSEPDRKR